MAFNYFTLHKFNTGTGFWRLTSTANEKVCALIAPLSVLLNTKVRNPLESIKIITEITVIYYLLF